MSVDPQSSELGWQEIKRTQELIERCLQKYMRQSEIIIALFREENIDAVITCAVWDKLEEQNRQFFEGYAVMIRVRDQINAFNVLVEQHNLLNDKLYEKSTKEESNYTQL